MRSLSLAFLPLLLAAAPLLVAARGYDGDLLAPFGISAQTNQEALMSFEPVGVSTFSPRLSLTAANSECCDCVHSVGRHILTEAMKSVNDACANVSCPVLKKRCDWIADHQDEFSGVLAVELRPLTDGYMYCMGNGTCDHPGVPKGDISSALFQSDSVSNPQLLLSQIAAAAPFVEKAMRMHIDKTEPETNDSEGDSRIALFARRIGAELSRFGRRRLSHGAVVAVEPETAATAVSTESSDKPRSCHSCLRHGVRWVLKRSLKHLKAACKETKCPHFQAFCKWAKEHKQVVRGMVYAHVQPWKAAQGWCAGVGSCHCGGKHHSNEQQQQQQQVETPANAPFTMGEKEEHEENKPAVTPIVPTPTKPIVIGRGKHDYMRHKQSLH